MFARQSMINAGKPIVAFNQNIRTYRSGQITGEFLSPDKTGRKWIPPGAFIARTAVGSRTVYRVLPRGKVTVAATTGSPRFKVKYPYCFVPGDVLSIVAPYATLTVGSTAAGTITLGTRSITVTPVGVTNATEAAAYLANKFNQAPYISDVLEFVPVAATLLAFSKDGFSEIDIATSGSIGGGPVTTVVNTTAIGTVLMIDTVTEEVVLVANSAIAVPIGVAVGQLVDEVYGLCENGIEFSEYRTIYSTGLISEAVIYKGALEYFDYSILRDLPELIVDYKF